MKRNILIALLVIALVGCDTMYSDRSDDDSKEGSAFVIGTHVDDTYYQTIYDPPAEFESEPCLIDFDGDNIDDVEIFYSYDRMQSIKEYEAKVVILNSNFSVASMNFIDTTYRCVKPTSDGQHTNEFTGSANGTCPADGVLSIAEVSTNKLARCCSKGDTLDNTLNWVSDQTKIMFGEKVTSYNDIEDSYTSTIHHGGKFFENGHYLAFRKTISSDYKYGYVKIVFNEGEYSTYELFEAYLDK